jgi:hypothetical protein
MFALLDPVRPAEAAESRRLLTRERPVGRSLPVPAVTSQESFRRIRVVSPKGDYALIVELAGPEPTWFRPTLEIFADLLGLPDDWNSYGAQPVTRAAVATAVKLLAEVLASDALPPQVVPTSAGGVQLEWHEGGVDLEVCVRPTGTVQVLFEDLASEVEWVEPFPHCRDKLVEVLERLHAAQ